MTPNYDPEKGRAYRAAAQELEKLGRSVKERLDEAVIVGDLQAGRDALAELKLPTENFEKLREELGPTGIFLAKYGVQIHNEHTVSFVLPRGVSRINILDEAQKLVTERDFIWPRQLEKWREDPKFNTKMVRAERFFIDGCVENSENEKRLEQEDYLKSEGKRLSLNLAVPELEDLAVAFVMHYIATRGQSIFRNMIVRVVGSALDFPGPGLGVNDIVRDRGRSYVAIAARAFPA